MRNICSYKQGIHSLLKMISLTSCERHWSEFFHAWTNSPLGQVEFVYSLVGLVKLSAEVDRIGQNSFDDRHDLLDFLQNWSNFWEFLKKWAEFLQRLGRISLTFSRCGMNGSEFL